MAVVNLRTVQPSVWIPPNSTAAYKLTVTRSDGTVDDITELITSATVRNNVTDSIGNFEFEIYNVDGTYTNIWTGNEKFKYYKDYAAAATTLVFQGRVEKPSKRGFKLNVRGRSESLRLMDLTVTKTFSSTECGAILTSILGSYATWVTTTNVGTSSKSLSVNWYQKPFWDCVKELCVASGFDAYLAADDDFHFFEQGSVVNTTEAILHDFNLLGVEDFTPDLTLVKNRIIVYGSVQEGIQVLASDEDSTSQSSYGVKELIINDENITTETTAQEVATYELSNRKDPPSVGSVKGWLLATVAPGDKLRISSPVDNLPPTEYITTGYKDRLDITGSGILSTTVYLTKEPRSVSHLLKDRIEQENKKKSTSLNPDEMRYSYNFPFDSDSGTHTTTQMEKGRLSLVTGNNNGNWVSDARTLSNDLDEAYLILNGETLNGVTISVSGDNGVNYQEVTPKNKLTISTAKGKKLKVKAVFSNADTQISSLSLLYKTE